MKKIILLNLLLFFSISGFAYRANVVFSTQAPNLMQISINGMLVNATPTNQVRIDQIVAGNYKISFNIFPYGINGISILYEKNIVLEMGIEATYVVTIMPKKQFVQVDKVNATPMASIPVLQQPIPVPPVINPIPEQPVNICTAKNNNMLISEEGIKALKNTIEKQSFSKDQLKIAKSALAKNNVLAKDVKDIMKILGFENDRLDFAKYAYDHTCDQENYYIVNDAFDFSSSVGKLADYINDK